MEEKTNKPSSDKIEMLIENKIAETKIIVLEKRLQFILTVAAGAFVLLGIIFPIWQARINTNEVDRAISRIDKKMSDIERDFERIAGLELRKPDIRIYYKGEDLGNKDMVFNLVQHENEITLQMKNVGDREAQAIEMLFYCIESEDVNDWKLSFGGFELSKLSDEKEYKILYEINKFSSEHYFYLNPKQSTFIKLQSPVQNFNGESCTIDCMMKIFYGQPLPTVSKFTIKVIK